MEAEEVRVGTLLGERQEPACWTPAIVYVCAVLIVMSIVSFCAPAPERAPTWHDRYVEDNCRKCRDLGVSCCITIPHK